MTRIEQSPDELEEQFVRQLVLLQKHVSSFEEEPSLALDIATKVRVLCHDTRQQNSLLGLLGRIDNIQIPSTYWENSTDNPRAPFCGLVYVYLEWSGARFVPKFDRHVNGSRDNFQSEYVNFQDWWNATVLRDYEGRELTRRDVVLEIADTDGGAHVDKKLKESYHFISRQHSLSWEFQKDDNEPQSVAGVELASMFQIGYELILALDPTYSPPIIRIEGIAGEFAINGDYGKEIFGRRLPFRMEMVLDIPKNTSEKYSPCPCGSGKKAKFCHPKGGKVIVQTKPI